MIVNITNKETRYSKVNGNPYERFTFSDGKSYNVFDKVMLDTLTKAQADGKAVDLALKKDKTGQFDNIAQVLPTDGQATVVPKVQSEDQYKANVTITGSGYSLKDELIVRQCCLKAAVEHMKPIKEVEDGALFKLADDMVDWVLGK